MSKVTFRERLDAIFWWLMWLLPLIGALTCIFLGSDNTFSDFSAFVGSFSFDFIKDIIVDIQEIASFAFPEILLDYASYLVSVEIIHVFVDVLVFLPRLCHKLVNADEYTWRFHK